jgi:hypothetical protein
MRKNNAVGKRHRPAKMHEGRREMRKLVFVLVSASAQADELR